MNEQTFTLLDLQVECTRLGMEFSQRTLESYIARGFLVGRKIAGHGNCLYFDAGQVFNLYAICLLGGLHRDQKGVTPALIGKMANTVRASLGSDDPADLPNIAGTLKIAKRLYAEKEAELLKKRAEIVRETLEESISAA